VPPNVLTAASATLAGAMNALQGADVEPTANQLKAMNDALAEARTALGKWTLVKTTNLPPANARLKAAGLAPIDLR
jgi:hypothetical protein